MIMSMNTDNALYFIVRSAATTDQQTMQLMRGFYLRIPNILNTPRFFAWVRANANMIYREGKENANF